MVGEYDLASNDRSRWLVTMILLGINAALWVIPSRLAYLVIQHRTVLLGRYSLAKFCWQVALLIFSVVFLCFLWSSGQKQKKRVFQIIAVSMSVFFSILVVDLGLRLIRRQQYVGTSQSYHRVPNTVDKGVVHDVPKESFSYPFLAPGYPDIPFVHSVDKRGFRNLTVFSQYDIVVLGDSFAEGSHVSDEQAWPVLLSERTQRTVYNLGMSGGDPANYLETLKLFGLGLKPRFIICMVYEGNDFRASNFVSRESASNRAVLFFRQSPLRSMCHKAIVEYFGGIGSGRLRIYPGVDGVPPICDRTHPLWATAWLPLSVPEGANRKYYAFDLPSLTHLLVEPENFSQSADCRLVFDYLQQIHQLCRENKIDLLVVFAPECPHVVLPLVRDRLDAEQVRAYLSYKMKSLPTGNELISYIMDRLDTHEKVTEAYCRKEGIPFLSLTSAMRREAQAGVQVYLTYNQHWTPRGNAIAASVIGDYLEKNLFWNRSRSRGRNRLPYRAGIRLCRGKL